MGAHKTVNPPYEISHREDYFMGTEAPSLPLTREVDSPQGEDGGREYYPSVSLFG